MYNIEVPSDKMRLFDSHMNKENIVYRMIGRSDDNTITKVVVKKEAEMIKAKEMVQKIVAKAELRKSLKNDEHKM